MQENYYLPIYQQIEREVIDLTAFIFFSDEQITLYSLKIADLIIRCSIEVESIAKDIYRRDTGKEPDKPGTAIMYLENTWTVSQKALRIVSPYTHFKSSFQPSFAPFNYEDKSSDDYLSTYNAIKHDRVKNIDKANINILIRVLGALYILNLYYGNERFFLDDDRYGSKINTSFSSEIFAFYVAPLEDIVKLTSQEKINPITCVYRIVRRESEYAFKVLYEEQSGEQHSWDIINISDEFQNWAKSLVGQKIDPDGFFSTLGRSILEQLKAKRVISVEAIKRKNRYFAEISKYKLNEEKK